MRRFAPSKIVCHFGMAVLFWTVFLSAFGVASAAERTAEATANVVMATDDVRNVLVLSGATGTLGVTLSVDPVTGQITATDFTSPWTADFRSVWRGALPELTATLSWGSAVPSGVTSIPVKLWFSGANSAFADAFAAASFSEATVLNVAASASPTSVNGGNNLYDTTSTQGQVSGAVLNLQFFAAGLTGDEWFSAFDETQAYQLTIELTQGVDA